VSKKKNPIEGVRQLVQRKFFGLAVERILYLLEQKPEDIELLSLLCGVYFDIADYYAAIDVGRRVLEQDPDNGPIWRRMSQSLLRTGDRDEAWEAACRFREVSKDHPGTLPLMIEHYERSNMLDEAEALLEEMGSDESAGDAYVYYGARLLVQRKKYDEAIPLIAKGIERSAKDTHLSTEYCYLLCKAQDRLGNYDDAWAAAAKAHEIGKKPWDQASFDLKQQETRAFFSPEVLELLPRATNHDEQPILICGNPRSGTSLLEQILSMHPDIKSGGEMSATTLMENFSPRMTDSYHEWPHCLMDMKSSDADAIADVYIRARRCIDANCKKVTNKSLVLQTQLGFLSLVLPGSKAIDLRRHPLDNCVSCYTTSIASVGHTYAHSLENMASTWIARRQMREHWRETLDMPILELHYEQLVSNQEFETKRLLKFLGVPWEPKCLDFHTSKRVAATISYDQVNKKMYSSSSGRWKRYEKHLGPLIDRFTEAGYL